jgi:hypothetical protein
MVLGGVVSWSVRSGDRKDIQQQVVRWVSSNAMRGDEMRGGRRGKHVVDRRREEGGVIYSSARLI